MANQRVYELARDLDLESKDLLERAHDLGIEVKTASSGLEEDAVALLRLSYEEEAPTAESTEPPRTAESTQPDQSDTAEGPSDAEGEHADDAAPGDAEEPGDGGSVAPGEPEVLVVEEGITGGGFRQVDRPAYRRGDATDDEHGGDGFRSRAAPYTRDRRSR